MSVAKGTIVRVIIGITDIAILEHRAVEGSLQHPAVVGSDFQIAIGVVATDFNIAIRQFGKNQSLGNIIVACGVNACIHSAWVDFGISRACRVDDGIVVLAWRIGIDTLMNAARIAQRVVAMSGKDNRLRILVEHGIQHLHRPRATRLQFRPRAIDRPTGRHMGKHEDGLARALLAGTLQIRLQQSHIVCRVGSRARRRAVGV